MCLTTTQREPMISDGTVKGWKVLIKSVPYNPFDKEKWITPYQHIDVTDIIEGSNPFIAEGKKDIRIISDGMFDIYKGFIHIFTNKRCATARANIVLYTPDVIASCAIETVIPKGVKYYVSDDKLEIAAESVMFCGIDERNIIIKDIL